MYPLYRRTGGPQGRSGWVRKISPSPGFHPRTFQPVASRYTDWAIPAHIYKVKFRKRLLPQFTSDICGIAWWCPKVLAETCRVCHKRMSQHLRWFSEQTTVESVEIFVVYIYIYIYMYTQYNVRPKSFKTSCFKRVLCVTSSGRQRNYVVLCFV